MNFNQFWTALEQGGETPEGDIFSVQNNKLHILSPGNRNKKFYTERETVERYFTTDIPEFGTSFGYKRSAYFLNVYRHIVGKAEYARVMAAALARKRR